MSQARHSVVPGIAVALLSFTAFLIVAAAGQPTSRPALPVASRPEGEKSVLVTTTRSTEALPEVSFEDLALLVKTARRAFEDIVGASPEHAARYRPPSLAAMRGIIHLTLRLHGAAMVDAESSDMDIVDAAVAAGTLLGQAALEKKVKIRDGGGDLGLEFEWLGPREYLEAKFVEEGRWSDELLHSFEPAVEGIGIEFRGRCGWTRPGQIVSLNYTPDLALQAAESAIGLTHADKLRSAREIRYYRFRSHHLWQPSATALPIVLTRGAVVVPAEAVSAKSLDAAIDRMGQYLHYRQNRDGFFSHEYLPSADRYGEGNSAAVQLEALYGLAAYAAQSGQPAIVADVKKVIGKCSAYLQPLSVVAGITGGGQAQVVLAGLVLAFPGHENYLEITSKLLLAALELRPYWGTAAPIREWATSQPATASAPTSAPVTTRPADLSAEACMEGVIRALSACQDENGGLEIAFQPRKEDEPEDVMAGGWALLALAVAGEWYSNADGAAAETVAQIERTIERALPHYRSICNEPVDPQAAAALARGLAAAYVRTKDARASDTAFRIVDEFAKLQVNEKNCPWPELYGAINAREAGSIGIDTADYLAALADGVGLAERIGDKDRAQLYRKAAQAAARFIMQLEVREEGSYYIRSPRDALGGVRASPWDNRIRADHCAEALLSLMRARQALYGPSEHHFEMPRR